MKTLKHVGEGYHGFDPGLDRYVFVLNGAIAEVSDGKADQLLSDFPKDWVAEEVCEKPPKKTQETAEEVKPKHSEETVVSKGRGKK